MKKLFVKPVAGRNVRDPHTMRHLPPEGAEVPASTYWVRCLKRGDVVNAPPQIEHEQE